MVGKAKGNRLTISVLKVMDKSLNTIFLKLGVLKKTASKRQNKSK